MEGIVAKCKDSRYHLGKRTEDFVKIINFDYAEVQIAVYRKGDIGWLVHYKGRPAGVFEFCVPPTQKQAFYGVVKTVNYGQGSGLCLCATKDKSTR